MHPTETIEEFYEGHPGMKMIPAGHHHQEAGHFNVYPRGSLCHSVTSYHRRDFYKISLSIGGGTIYYADKGISFDKCALVFSNPTIPYSWEAAPMEQTGYFCLFTEDFISSNNRSESFINSPLFSVGGSPVYFVNDEQVKIISDIFCKMLDEIDSDYMYKYDLLRNYVNLIVHEALKLKPADTFFKHSNASSRIASLFMELLERQFPIDSPNYALKLKTAADYASRLSVHVNHLNRAVKEITGKTTSMHIAERVAKEAKALLRYTDWNIADIAYSLGFEYPAYFNNFFKKQTALNPKAFRV
ncbi:helix-turn-helix domain-containing protein [Mucilaginibacter lappiensis]|uniref:AraC-like DNA-binding protein n=1 Tax=Mucilaginibacter lappiensis TaxID=354630 RepID=A0A1N7DX64_9SPHI|nr:helix-turn-helix domain-containing protein [Mucilaginibacter lappiensis]MBB6111497.1 AraC-like DNA-binding protein [Mucilaginibacter lappiensis]MBB6130166.1 AraC-like DNA-binding protein [Mucilaginibacter lappiensis]SIR80275.1 Helix-turn-helix domain-containing protein [Mucilaginibacter lappiensis]